MEVSKYFGYKEIPGRGELEEWPAHPVSVAESSSPMPGLSPKQGLEDSQILQDLVKAVSEIAVQTYRMEHKLMQMQDQVFKLLEVIERFAAEDQDPDEMPATYMDGSRVR